MNKYLLMLSLAAISQAAEISTIGYGEVAAWPNYVEFQIETRVVQPRLRDALDESRVIEDKAIGITKNYGQSADSSAYDLRTITDKETRWSSGAKKEEFLGYSASQVFTAKLIDLEKVTSFVDEILKLPATRIASLRFRHTKEDSLKTAAEIVSVNDAVKKGRLIAKSLSIDTLKIKSISDYLELKKPDRWELQEEQGFEINVYSKGIGVKNISFSPSSLVFTSRTHVVQTGN